MLKLRSGILGLTLTSALVLAAASANAADIYRPEAGGYKDGPAYVPVNTWTGFYIGANGGYGWNANHHSDDLLDPAGGFGGGQIGYNWQGGFGFGPHLVLGIEADIQGADISDSVAGVKSQVNWFGTVRGRIGYAFDRTLIYGTGGFAYGEVETAFLYLARRPKPKQATLLAAVSNIRSTPLGLLRVNISSSIWMLAALPALVRSV